MLLVTQSYDAILLDLTLPGLKGETLLKNLRSKNNEVPVLIISAKDTLQDIIDHLNLGADDYLAKPFDIQELEARLRSLLRRASGRTNPVMTCGGLHYDSNSKKFSSHGHDLTPDPTRTCRAGSPDASTRQDRIQDNTRRRFVHARRYGVAEGPGNLHRPLAEENRAFRRANYYAAWPWIHADL